MSLLREQTESIFRRLTTEKSRQQTCTLYSVTRAVYEEIRHVNAPYWTIPISPYLISPTLVLRAAGYVTQNQGQTYYTVGLDSL